MADRVRVSHVNTELITLIVIIIMIIIIIRNSLNKYLLINFNVILI